MKGSRSDNDEVSRRVLRRKKRLCYAESLMRRNSFQSRRLRRRRYRSWDSNSAKIQRTASLLRFHRASSVSSLDSVVYLGRHRKIPPLVVLSDTSTDDERPSPPYKSKLRKFRDAVVAEKRPAADLRVDVLQNESELLNMMQDMHVGPAATNNYTCTRTSVMPQYQA